MGASRKAKVPLRRAFVVTMATEEPDSYWHYYLTEGYMRKGLHNCDKFKTMKEAEDAMAAYVVANPKYLGRLEVLRPIVKLEDINR